MTALPHRSNPMGQVLQPAQPTGMAPTSELPDTLSMAPSTQTHRKQQPSHTRSGKRPHSSAHCRASSTGRPTFCITLTLGLAASAQRPWQSSTTSRKGGLREGCTSDCVSSYGTLHAQVGLLRPCRYRLVLLFVPCYSCQHCHGIYMQYNTPAHV